MDVGKADRIRVYLNDADSFIKEAESELDKGIQENNSYLIRDSAEKMWNAVIQAANATILYYLDKAPSSHFERRKLLSILEEKMPEIENMGFRDRYAARERNLHELVFYEGIIDIDEIRKELRKVKRYASDVVSLIVSKEL